MRMYGDVNDNRVKGFLLVLVACLFTMAMVIKSPTSQPEYVNIIYEMYPTGFYWLLNITVVSIFILLYYSILNENKKAEYISILSYIVWLILFYQIPKSKPLIYGTSHHDSFYHLGIIYYIIDNGFHPGGDIYPGAHFLFVISLRISNINIFNLEPTLSVYHRLLFISGIMVYTRYLWGSKAGKTSAIVSAPFVFGISSRTIAPISISFSLIPLVIFTFHSLSINIFRKKSRILIFIIFIPAITILHPLAAIYLISLLIIFYIESKRLPQLTNKIRNLDIYYILFSILMALFWIIFNKILFGLTTSTIFANLLESDSSSSKTSNSVIELYFSALQSSPASLPTLIYEVLIIEYGAIMLFGVISFASFLYILYYQYPEDVTFSVHYIIAIYIFSVLVFLSLLYFYAIIGSPTRAVRLAMFVSILLITYVIFTLSSNNETVARVVVAVVLLTMVISTPVIYSTNFHTYPSTIEGSEWSHSYQEDYRTDSHLSSKLSYYTLRGDVSHTNLVFKPSGVNDPPKDLGYNDSSTYGKNITKERYLILTKMDFIRHKPHSKVRWGGFEWLISEHARNSLRQDKSLQKIYSSSQYNVWKVRQNGPETI